MARLYCVKSPGLVNTSAHQAFYWNKRQFATNKVKPKMHANTTLRLLIRVNYGMLCSKWLPFTLMQDQQKSVQGWRWVCHCLTVISIMLCSSSFYADNALNATRQCLWFDVCRPYLAPLTTLCSPLDSCLECLVASLTRVRVKWALVSDFQKLNCLTSPICWDTVLLKKLCQPETAITK